MVYRNNFTVLECQNNQGVAGPISRLRGLM